MDRQPQKRSVNHARAIAEHDQTLAEAVEWWRKHQKKAVVDGVDRRARELFDCPCLVCQGAGLLMLVGLGAVNEAMARRNDGAA